MPTRTSAWLKKIQQNIKWKFRIHGQGSGLQSSVSFSNPWQGFPPPKGAGLEQERERDLVPPMHETEHGLHSSQGDQAPSSTGTKAGLPSKSFSHRCSNNWGFSNGSCTQSCNLLCLFVSTCLILQPLTFSIIVENSSAVTYFQRLHSSRKTLRVV